MNAMFRVTLGISVLLLTSCVSKKKFSELNIVKDHYKSEFERLEPLEGEKSSLEAQLRGKEKSIQDMLDEQKKAGLKITSLEEANLDLTNRYNNLLNQNKNILNTTSSEKQNLQGQLSERELELRKKEEALRLADMAAKEKINEMQSLQQSLSQREARVKELEAALSAKEQQMANLKSSIDAALRGFSAADLTVTEKEGKLYVSMSQNLLFKSGSDKIDPKGITAIKQVAEVLAKNQDIKVTVEGHTDTDGTPDKNWDLSTLRATSVVKEMVKNGLEPKRITASGRAFYAPVAPNDNAENKGKNRRTEIILSPQLDVLYDIIKG